MTNYERATEYTKIVLYDANCPYCSVITKALHQVKDLGAVSWEEPPAQSFLEAQFGETPFTVIFVNVTEGQVYAGNAAARELALQTGIPNLISKIVENEFDRIDATINTLGGHETDTESFHGEFELTEDGRAAFDDLAYIAWTLPKR